jgi:acetyl/propionyl-CoA carboxylase alpha subunit
LSAHPSIHKILIANRGEIALRILRAACLLSIPAMAVYSEHEKDSPWVRHFQESWSLGAGNLKDTYLNAEALVAIAKKSGADAIHPGYGFLSENYQFAQACEETISGSLALPRS